MSPTVSLIAPVIGLVSGSALGLLAAYYDGLPRTAILALLDAMLAFPSLVFALGLTVVLGPSIQNVTLALGEMSIPAFARIAQLRLGEGRSSRSAHATEPAEAID